MSEDGYVSKEIVLPQKPCEGNQRKIWNRMIDDIFTSLDLEKDRLLQDIENGYCSMG